MFGVRDGVVDQFELPNSFMDLQDPALLPPLLGDPTMSSNEVLALATRTIERLARTTNPIAHVQPVVDFGRRIYGKTIPFYLITWPKPYYRPGFGYFAGIEVDARKRQITHLELHDPAFYNYALAQQISNLVWIPEPAKAPVPTNSAGQAQHARHYPLPSTNDVERAIAGWLWLCKQFNLDSSSNSTPAAVNWDGTCLLLDDAVGASNQVPCRVEFKDGTWFSALGVVAQSHHARDMCWAGNWQRRTKEEWLLFNGRINKHWEELANGFDQTLRNQLGVPVEVLARYRPHVEFGPTNSFGDITLKRVLVAWLDRTNLYNQGYAAEFDLETGKLTGLGVTDPEIIQAFGRVSARFAPRR